MDKVRSKENRMMETIELTDQEFQELLNTLDAQMFGIDVDPSDIAEEVEIHAC